MHTPTNLPSSTSRGNYRETPLSRLQATGLFQRSLRHKQPATAAVRPLLSSFICLSAEPEDAKITGATRSLSRRLLALNIRHDS